MKKAYRIERQNGKGEWRPSAVYTDTYSAPEAISILHASEAAFVNYRMVWGYAPTTDDVVENDDSAVWVVTYTYVATEDIVIGVFSTEEKAQAHVGWMFITDRIGHNTLEITKHTIDKGV